jgi:hypothetical protein
VSVLKRQKGAHSGYYLPIGRESTLGIEAMSHFWVWLNANSSAIQALTATVIMFLTVLLARLSRESDRNSKRALAFTRDQFDREWSLDLYVRISEASEPPARIQVTNLGKASAMVHTIMLRRQSRESHSKRFALSVAIPHGQSAEINIQDQLNEFVWKNVTRVKQDEGTPEWAEQAVELELALQAHSAGRDSVTPWVKSDLVLKVHPTYGSSVIKIRGAATASLNLDHSSESQ